MDPENVDPGESRAPTLADLLLLMRIARVKNKPPLLLILVAASYLIYLAWIGAVDFSAVVAGRFALSAILFFFVLRGNRVAGNILAILTVISAVVLFVAAVATFKSNAVASVLFCATATLLLGFSAYMYFSPPVRLFQGGGQQGTSPAG